MYNSYRRFLIKKNSIYRIFTRPFRALENSIVLLNITQKQSSKAKELHRASNDMVRYKETKRVAESAKAQAEAKLSNAK